MNGKRITGIIILLMVIMSSISFPVIRTIFEDEEITCSETFGTAERGYESHTDATRTACEIDCMEPKNDSIINTTKVTLRWALSESQNLSMNYSVYVGESGESLYKKSTTNDTVYVLEDLDYDKTYFWQIVPESDADNNFSQSAVYSFTIKKQSPITAAAAEEEQDYLSVILGIALLFFVVIAFVIMRIQRHKNDKEMQKLDSEENDIIDAEIEHVPEPGKARSTYETRPVFEPEIRGSMENTLYRQEEIMPLAENEVRAASLISLIKAMEMMRQRAVATKQRNDFDISNIHLPTELELESTAEQMSEEILALPAPKVIEVEKKLQKVPIDELFLITPSGLLVQHYSLERESGLKEDVLAGMLTAVKSFISDSLSLLDRSADEESEINRIDFGKYSVLMYSGKTMSLVAITSHGNKESIMSQLKKSLGILEERFGHLIKDWDGDTSKVEDIKPCIEQMVKGELLEKPSPTGLV